MGELIRSHDWSATPLGRVEGWPQALRTSLELVLQMPQPAGVLWGPEATLLYNDEYRRLLPDKHPSAFGRPFTQVWAEQKDAIAPALGAVMAGAPQLWEDAPFEVAGRAEGLTTAWFTASWTPIRLEDGTAGGFLLVATETTARHRAEQARRQVEERQSFLLKLSDAMRAEEGADAIIAAATKALGERLGASRIVYAEIDEAAGVARIRPGWARDGVDVHPAELRLSDFGGALLDDLRAGRTVRYDDVGAAPYEREDFAALAAVGVRAGISVPLMIGGQLVVTTTVQQDHPRAWTDADAELVEEVAERSWAAVERARAEAALRESARLQSAMLEVLPLGLAIIGTDGRVVISNPNFTRFLPNGRLPSRDPERASRWRAWDSEGRLIDPQHYPGARSLRGEQVLPGMEFLYTEDDGKETWTSVASVPLRDERGNVTGVVSIIHDIDAAKRASEALRGSEERFRALVTAGNVSVYRMSPDWRRMYQLDSSNFLENTPEPIEDWADYYILPEDRERVFAAIGTAIKTKSMFELEHRVRLADGSIGWVLSRAVPILSPGGEIREWFGAGTDVTARKRAEAALREAEERHRAELERQVAERTAELAVSRDLLKAIIDSSTDMIQVFKAVRDESGEIVDFIWLLNNQTSESQFGEVQGESLLQRNPGVVVEGIFDTFKRVVETGEPDQAERHYAHEQFDGWFLQSVVKLDDGVATTTKDITEWKNSQEQVLRLQEEVARARLYESEERMRILVTGIPQLVFRSASDGCRTWGSPQWIEYTGVSFEDSLGFGWLEAVHPDDRDATLAAWQGVEERGEYYVEHRIYDKASGRWCWHQTRATPLRDTDGRILEWLGTSTEVEELRQLQRHQQVLLGELQHRVRNMLAVVRSIARRTAESSDSVQELNDHLQGRIAAFSRVQAAVTRNPEGGIDLAGLVEDELLAHALREGEQLRIKGPRLLLKARPAESLSLAIHELATNAVKYGAIAAPAGRIEVRWRCEEGESSKRLVLEWDEQGVEPAVPTPTRRGFGLELLERTLPYDLGAETRLDFRPEGVRFEMAMPLVPAVVGDEASV